MKIRILMLTLVSIIILGCGMEIRPKSVRFAESTEHTITLNNYQSVVTRHLPLKVILPADKYEKEIAQRSIAAWNEFFKDEGVVMEVTTIPTDANVSFRPGSEIPDSLPFAGLAITLVVEDNPICIVRVKVLQELTMTHELGHCLGFAHSDNQSSIMWATDKSDGYFVEEMIDLLFPNRNAHIGVSN